MLKTQFVEPTGRKDNIFYESFSTTVDDTVEEIVALASTLGLTSAADIPEGNEGFYAGMNQQIGVSNSTKNGL